MRCRGLHHFSAHNSNSLPVKAQALLSRESSFPPCLTVVVPVDLVLGDWSKREEWCKGHTRQKMMFWEESSWEKFASWLHLLLQYDSVLVRKKRFGCSSRTQPVVNEDLGQHALLLSEDPLSSLPESVCSGSGRNVKPNTYVSDMLQGVCYSPAICDSQICQPVTTQGNPLYILPLPPIGSSLLSD